ncbi:22K [Duck adenovirus 2]|nr:22K [Duck adenovirus 2]
MTQKQVDAMKEQRELDRSREEDDWESIGSEDTYSEVSDEEEEDGDLEGFITSSEDQPPPSPKIDLAPKKAPKQKKRKLAVPPTTNPKQKKARSATATVTEKTSKAAVRSLVKRGKYTSWAQYRVDIYQALRDAVFDRSIACKILKGRGIYVPPPILAYYGRQLCSSSCSSSVASSSPISEEGGDSGPRGGHSLEK